MTVHLIRDRKPAGRTLPDSQPRFRGWRALFPRLVVMDLARVSFSSVERLNTPPAGEPFYLDGKPYATQAEFIDDLAEEFRAQLTRYAQRSPSGRRTSEEPRSRQAKRPPPVQPDDLGRAWTQGLVKGGAAPR
jgi:hypothetical protein